MKNNTEINFIEILSETQESIKNEIIKLQGKLEMIQEIIEYLKVKKLKVLENVEKDNKTEEITEN